MSDRERRKAEVIEFFNAKATPKRKSVDKRVKIRGDNNVVAGRDVNVNKRLVVRPTIQPGPGHITPEQAARLKERVLKAADIEVAAGMDRGAAMQKWWSILKRHYRVTTYREIPRDLGEEAIAWLGQQIAMKRPRLRRTVNHDWRKEHYSAIYARAKELGLSKGEVYALAHKRLGKRVTSLRQLGEQSLQKLYRIIMSLGH